MEPDGAYSETFGLLPAGRGYVAVMRWFHVLLPAAALCAGCSSAMQYMSSPVSPTPTSVILSPSAAGTSETGPIPRRQCTSFDRVLATHFRGWRQAGYPAPSGGLTLLDDDAIAAVTSDSSQEPSGVDAPDAQALQSALQALEQQVPVPGYSTPGESYGQDLATVKADGAWWAACS
jgi:hypothetical protein